jgi:hypothetical protein
MFSENFATLETNLDFGAVFLSILYTFHSIKKLINS